MPIITLLAIILMLFVPSYRFIFSGEVGEQMSASTLISNSWEQARNILFGTAEHTDAALIFSRTLFIVIIVFVILLLLSLFISVWSAFVAFRCFWSDDEEGAQKSRNTFVVFVPNRVVLSAFLMVGLLIATFPYLMKPLYMFAYSQRVSVVLEAPDALIVGGALFVATCILSVICAKFERAFDADIFNKQKNEADDYSDGASEEASEVEYSETDDDTKERIRRLFEDDKK